MLAAAESTPATAAPPVEEDATVARVELAVCGAFVVCGALVTLLLAAAAVDSPLLSVAELPGCAPVVGVALAGTLAVALGVGTTRVVCPGARTHPENTSGSIPWVSVGHCTGMLLVGAGMHVSKTAGSTPWLLFGHCACPYIRVGSNNNEIATDLIELPMVLMKLET